NQKIEPEKNKERKDIYINQYIGFKDPKALTYQSKLILNDLDRDLYSSYLVQLNTPLNISKLPVSNQLMVRAFQYFVEKLKTMNLAKNGEDIVDFIESILSNKLIFIQIVVDDSLSAYTVFETLNARGVELTTTDLIKNYLFSLLDSEIDINNLHPRWNKIVDTVSYRRFPVFLRYFFNSQQRMIRTERLFKEIKARIPSKDQVFNLLSELERYADIYVALDDPDNELWHNNKNVRTMINELLLFDAQQYKSLLLSVYFKMGQYFEDALRIVRALTFRYNVIGKLNPNRLEEAYNNVAIKVYNGEILTPQAIQQELNNVYIDDEIFKNSFSTIYFNTDKQRDKKLVRYILLSIENKNFHKDYHLFDTNATIEHIFPENYDNTAEKMSEVLISRLGNLALLEASLNRECSNKSFNEKKEIYLKSQYEMTRKLAEKTEWNADEIKNRQEQLARIATSIWRFPY
ncbi:MAG TPA: HNH endonuclease family protein, partial [Bacteroidales bacterium]|nr:HNH endonuclease family protein [Bacteroidales bacterium]